MEMDDSMSKSNVENLNSFSMIRIIFCIFLLITAIFSQTNPDTVNSIIERENSAIDNEINLLGIQDNENWLVLRVEFPNQNFPDISYNQMFFGDNSISEYINQLTGGDTDLSIHIHDEIWKSPYTESYWGTDLGEIRDYGSQESGGASALASTAIEDSFINLNLSKWDLDGDLVIDRLLILHSGNAQELGGSSTSIWSHYSQLESSIELSGYIVEHYTMASIHGGIGVILHEMMHQMGAVDLYDVHSNTPSRNWHGLGDWDIMASGNWINNGNSPSLPGAATLDLIGAINPIKINPKISDNYTIKPTANGGNPLVIDLSEGEKIWISLRSNIGFDKGLPGHGILLEHQDSNFGDFDDNEVNSDPKMAWVKIIEADGDDALQRARDYGSNGDVFQVNSIFGSLGHPIRDNRGLLAQWTISITNISSDSATIYFQSHYPNISVKMPRNPIELLDEESIFIDIILDTQCTFLVEYNEELNINSIQIDLEEGYHNIKIYDNTNIISKQGIVSGKLGCMGESFVDFNLQWYIVGHKLSNSTLESTIIWDSKSTIELYPVYFGNNSRIYSISLDGPVERIGTVVTQGNINTSDSITLDINPNGLLEPGMIAKGDLVFIDNKKTEQRIPIILTSNYDLPFMDLINWLSIPSNTLTVITVSLFFSLVFNTRNK